MKNKFYINILPEKQKMLLDRISETEWIKPFYLAGGTGLALQTGHRKSIDFDFFTGENFSIKKLINFIKKSGNFELLSEDIDTLHCIFEDVKLSFFKVNIKLLKETISYKNLLIASTLDIALMKLNAISGRGSKKDFIDLYFLLEKYYSLQKLFEEYENKYGISVSNNYHLLKSLLYFQDAEKEPMPELIEHVSWSRVKKRIAHYVKNSGYI